MAVINDTVGTMMTCGYDDHLCEIGLIVGESGLLVILDSDYVIGTWLEAEVDEERFTSLKRSAFSGVEVAVRNTALVAQFSSSFSR